MGKGVYTLDQRITWMKGEVAILTIDEDGKTVPPEGTPTGADVWCGDGTEFCMEVTMEQLQEILYRVKDSWFTSGSIIGTSSAIPWTVYATAMTTEKPMVQVFLEYYPSGEFGEAAPEYRFSYCRKGFCVPETVTRDPVPPAVPESYIDTANGVASANYEAAYTVAVTYDPEVEYYTNYYGEEWRLFDGFGRASLAEYYRDVHPGSVPGTFVTDWDHVRDQKPEEFRMWQQRIGRTDFLNACGFNHYCAGFYEQNEIPG